jgi:hypothetical protein
MAFSALSFFLVIIVPLQSYDEPNVSLIQTTQLVRVSLTANTFQAGVGWCPDLWEIGSAVNIHSSWPTTGMTLGFDEEEEEYFPIPGPRNAERLGTFATLDFRIARQFPVKVGRVSAFLEVTNATDRRNECCIDYDIDEDENENVFLGISVEHWLPRIIAVKLLWEF